MGRAMVLLLILGLTATSAQAGERIRVRLVEATQKGRQSIDSNLDDISGLLESSLPYKSYRLVDTKFIPLPADHTVRLSKHYSFSCKGTQANMRLRLLRDGREITASTVALKDKTPLIQGGFPSDADKDARMLVVLTAE